MKNGYDLKKIMNIEKQQAQEEAIRINGLLKKAHKDILDVRFGYPDYIPRLHDQLWGLAEIARNSAVKKTKTLNGKEKTKMRKDEANKIFSFFGYELDDGSKYVTLNQIFPSAMEAVESTIHSCCRPYHSVLVLDPAYEAFSELVERVGDRNRNTIHVDCSINPSIVEIKQAIDSAKKITNEVGGEMTVDLIVVNIPRNPDMYVYDDKFLNELAKLANKENITILYDEVFNLSGPSTSFIIRKGSENRLSTTFPKSDSHVIIRDTGKILPEPFPKLAAVHVSDSCYSHKGGGLIGKENRRRNLRNPSTADIYMLAKILHSKQFPNYITRFQQINTNNFKSLEVKLNLPMVQCGPFALIDLASLFPINNLFRLTDVQLLSFQFSSFFQTLGSYYGFRIVPKSAKSIIRFPLTMSKEMFEEMVNLLIKKLEIIRKLHEELS